MQRTTLPDGTRIIIKQRRDAPTGFFHAEARGLAALRDAHALRVPEVLEAADDRIVLEDLGDGTRATRYWQRAGAGLARQHCSIGTHFGFNHDGFCGDRRTTRRTTMAGDSLPSVACCRRCAARVTAD